ncbi:MAG: hypothetical protein E6H92_00660 [Chloroflexi bacterium]|nr:MAG: hypothetical protein E6H92_00660 [Chloroflexota bacterium]
MRAADYVVTTSDKGKEGNMRKLLIVTAAAAGIFVSTVAVNAATPAGTYSHSKGSYALCVTNNVVDSGATQLVQISLGGLPRQPQGLTSPLGWSASTSSAGSTWTATWTTFGNGLGQDAQLCGFGFKDHGRQLTTALPLTLQEMTPDGSYCCEGLTSTAARV